MGPEVVVKSSGQIAAERIGEIRRRKGWSQQDLADAIADVGGAQEGSRVLSRTAIAKIEAGGTRAANLSVEELLVIASALGVAPLHLVVPPESEWPGRLSTRLQVTPGNERRDGIRMTPDTARAWIRGVGSPPGDRDLLFYLHEAPPSERESHGERRAAMDAALVASGIPPKESAEGAAALSGGLENPPPEPDDRSVRRKPKRPSRRMRNARDGD